VFFKSEKQNHNKEKPMKASPNSVIPLVNEKQIPAGNPSGVTWEAGLEAILCHTAVNIKGSALVPSELVEPHATCAFCCPCGMMQSHEPKRQYYCCISSATTTLVQQTGSSASLGSYMFRFLRPLK